MLVRLRTFITYVVLSSAVLVTLFTAGFLQEFAADELPARLKETGFNSGAETLRVEVSIQRMSLTLFAGDVMLKRYDIGYGTGSVGQRAKAGCTPLGEYRIVAKEKRKSMYDHGSRFLLLNYPSEDDTDRGFAAGLISNEDRERIERARALGERLPTDTPFGGPIGIQGNYWFFRNRRFTDGNVALSNGDINEVFNHLPVGTRVTIQLE